MKAKIEKGPVAPPSLVGSGASGPALSAAFGAVLGRNAPHERGGRDAAGPKGLAGLSRPDHLNKAPKPVAGGGRKEVPRKGHR